MITMTRNKITIPISRLGEILDNQNTLVKVKETNGITLTVVLPETEQEFSGVINFDGDTILFLVEA